MSLVLGLILSFLGKIYEPRGKLCHLLPLDFSLSSSVALESDKALAETTLSNLRPHSLKACRAICVFRGIHKLSGGMCKLKEIGG